MRAVGMAAVMVVAAVGHRVKDARTPSVWTESQSVGPRRFMTERNFRFDCHTAKTWMSRAKEKKEERTEEVETERETRVARIEARTFHRRYRR